MPTLIEFDGKNFFATDAASVQTLYRGFFGTPFEGKGDKILLPVEEALYLMDVRNASCAGRKGEPLGFNDVAKPFRSQKKFLARYFCMRDWRDRGLVARPVAEVTGKHGHAPVVKYPSLDYAVPKARAKALFFPDDLFAVIDDAEEGARLYDEEWFGQYATYKSRKHGSYLKLDAYETVFLAKHGGLKLDVSADAVTKAAVKRRSDFESLYDVFEDWRMRGFILKTGFKFGTHFRLYFPGAKANASNDEWVHSKHVIHVFPRDARLLISEWARAIRVAHGVKKTFILAIPGAKRAEKAEPAELDFALFHRQGDRIENPRQDAPRFAMLALSEEEEIGGEELAAAIAGAKKLGLDLVLSICDRETSVTHYRVKAISLAKSRYEYYEIEWMQP